MISLVASMLRSRRGQAIALVLLAMCAVAAAVAAPAYLRAVDRAVVSNEVAAAAPAERGLTVGAKVEDSGGPSDPGGLNFLDVGAAIITMPGFKAVHASQYPVLGLETDPHAASQMVFRQDVCAHLAMVSGRCLIGEGEVVIGERAAQRLKLIAGNPVSLTFATMSSDPRTPWYLPDGLAKPVAVVGIYRTPAPDDPYWGAHGYFAVDPTGEPGEPVFTNAATMVQMSHGATLESIDATPLPGTFDVDHLGALRGDLTSLGTRIAGLGQSVAVSTSIPRLLDRIDRSRSLAHQTVPVLAVPLIMLAYFVIFLAAGYGADSRGQELAVVALRGARWRVRWWLAVGESMVAIVAGALAGCVAGQLLVAALVAGRLPEIDILSAESLRYAPAATLGALLVAVLAQRRQIGRTVVDQLRQIPARLRGWRLAVGEAALVVLAVLAATQLWSSDGSLVGVGLFAPALVMLAVALAGSRLLRPLATRYGGRALRRGRLGAALAAFHLARRPGPQRLFLLLAGAVAILGFASCALDVAAQDRDIAARVGTGAPRVVSVGEVTREQLLHAVRQADPEGRYAMAVARLPAGAPGEAPKLAVDSSRLATVASWPGNAGALSAAEVARRLRPETPPPPVVVPGQDVTLDLSVTGANTDTPLSLNVVLASTSGRGTVTIPFGVLHNGPYTYQQRAPECFDGCRLVGFHLTTETSEASSVALSLTLRGLRTVNPSRTALTADQFGAGHWRIPAGGSLTPVPDGLRVDFDAPDGLPGGGWVLPIDAPYPLPVVSTAALPAGATIAGLDGQRTPVNQTGRVSAVPRLGIQGTLVDLEYADRVSTDGASARQPEVWLGPAAPADVLSRLAGQGLVITSDVGVDAARQQLDSQGPALASRFYPLVGGLAILLAAAGLTLVAAVDRRSRATELAALRTQGVDRGTVRRSLLWGYPAMALAAGAVGAVAALVAWRLTGWALPVFSTEQPALALPILPSAGAFLIPFLVAEALLAAIALVIAEDLRRKAFSLSILVP